MTTTTEQISAAKQTAERLRVMAFAIDKMRAAVPEGGGRGPERVIGPFSVVHEEMIKDLLAVVMPWLPGLKAEVTCDHLLAPGRMRVLGARWLGRPPDAEDCV